MLLYMHILLKGRHRKPQLVLPLCHVWESFMPPTQFPYRGSTMFNHASLCLDKSQNSVLNLPNSFHLFCRGQT
ncbi:hypothetical protein INR49_031268 [Caranx melampygus]|nr:hypothetical protein INR49_031268 [Caranx melampygus]